MALKPANEIIFFFISNCQKSLYYHVVLNIQCMM